MRVAHAKIVIASTAALVGAVIAWRALFPVARATDGAVAPPEPIPTEGFLAVADVRFDAFPEREPIEGVVERMRGRLAQLLIEDHPEWVSSTARLEGLVALAGERLGLLLAPDYDAWLDQVRRFGGQPPEATPEFRDRWDKAASRLAGVPLSIGQMWGRTLWRGGVREEDTPDTLIYLGASISGRYAAATLSPEASRLDVYEVIIPAGFKSRDVTKHDNTVMLGMQFAWKEDRAQWSPYKLILYRPMSSFNGEWLLEPVW